MTEFVERSTAMIATWHNIKPPSDAALRTLADLERTIRDFEELRGTLCVEDECRTRCGRPAGT